MGLIGLNAPAGIVAAFVCTCFAVVAVALFWLASNESSAEAADVREDSSSDPRSPVR